MGHSVFRAKAQRNSYLTSIGGMAGIIFVGMAGPAFSVEQCMAATVDWQRSLGDLDLRTAVFTADGRHLIVGAGVPQPGPHDESAQTPHDAAVLAIDWDTGATVWQAHVAGDGAREIEAMTITPGGDVVVLGQLGHTPVPIGGFQDEFAWAARLSSAGEVLWEKQFGTKGSLHGFFSGLAFEDESVLFAGWTEISSHEADDGYGWLVRVEPNGEYRWDIPIDNRILGIFPRDETSTIVLLGGEDGQIDFWDLDEGAKLFPWGGVSLGLDDIWIEDVWIDGIIDYDRVDNLLIRGMQFDDVSDKDLILRPDENGGIRWRQLSVGEWPWINGLAGTQGDLLILPNGVDLDPYEVAFTTASELLVLGAVTGEHKGALRTDLAHMAPRGVVAIPGGYDIALFGVDTRGADGGPWNGDGLLAKVAVSCE